MTCFVEIHDSYIRRFRVTSNLDSEADSALGLAMQDQTIYCAGKAVHTIFVTDSKMERHYLVSPACWLVIMYEKAIKPPIFAAQ